MRASVWCRNPSGYPGSESRRRWGNPIASSKASPWNGNGSRSFSGSLSSPFPSSSPPSPPAGPASPPISIRPLADAGPRGHRGSPTWSPAPGATACGSGELYRLCTTPGTSTSSTLTSPPHRRSGRIWRRTPDHSRRLWSSGTSGWWRRPTRCRTRGRRWSRAPSTRLRSYWGSSGSGAGSLISAPPIILLCRKMVSFDLLFFFVPFPFFRCSKVLLCSFFSLGFVNFLNQSILRWDESKKR